VINSCPSPTPPRTRAKLRTGSTRSVRFFLLL
jgi:hypothetical protein